MKRLALDKFFQQTLLFSHKIDDDDDNNNKKII